MYYKIVNKECDVYKKLHKQRMSEIQMAKDNLETLREKIGLKFDTFLGHQGQQNFRRVPQYDGFVFLEPEKVDLKVWQLDKKEKSVYVPNRKTKVGREMSDFLSNGLKGSRYDAVFTILKLPHLRKFSFPYLEIVGKTIIIYLGDGHEPKDKNVIEITKKEFNDILEKERKKKKS